MALSSSEILQRLEKPVNQDLIAKAISHEDRIRFHSQRSLGSDDVSSYYQVFLDKIKAILPSDKYDRFVQVLDFPIPTNELVDTIFSELSKVYDAQNKHISFQFSRIEYREDFENYLDWMEDGQFWSNECFEAIRNCVNCIQVVDLPITKTGRLPEPYIYNLAIENVIDIDALKDGNIAFLLFWDTTERIISIDEEYYRVFQVIDGDIETAEEISFFKHELGYAPCRFLMTDNLNSSNNVIKVSPITKSLWALDRLLFRMISKENLEDYAAYPIYSMYDEPCTYKDFNGNVCNGGLIHGVDRYKNEYQIKCPACKDNFYIGPGSILTSKAPRTKESPDLLKNVHVTPADIESLDYNKISVDERKAEILQSCVGSDQDQLQGQAQNEKQILSTYETKQAVLMWLKRNIELAHKFSIDTRAKLRYGKAYLGCTVDYGNRFYLATNQQLNEKLKVAKENGASMFEIDMIKDEIYSNEYRNNPEQLQRIEILKRLEPYYGMTIADLNASAGLFMPNPIDLIIKLNFAYFISKFEDQNGSITDFGVLLPMHRRIEIIQTQLYNYGNEQFKKQPKQLGGEQGSNSGQSAA